MNHRYTQEVKERAVRLVAEVRDQHESARVAIGSASAKLGTGSAETLCKWGRQAETEAAKRPGVTREASAESRRLKAENCELRRANELLKAATGFFAAHLCATRGIGSDGGAAHNEHQPVRSA